MDFGNLNILFFAYLFIFFIMLTNMSNFLHLMLIAELAWVILFLLVLTIGFGYNNLNLLALTFFFLIFSAIEFSLSLILMLCQNLLTRSIKLNTADFNTSKFFNRFLIKIFINNSFKN